MGSLTRHLTAGDEHDALTYHPDCARCAARLGPPPTPLAGRTGVLAMLASTVLAIAAAPTAATARASSW